MRIATASLSTAQEVWEDIEPHVRSSQHLEDAAQLITKELHAKFVESVVLARVFVTLPFQCLPPANRDVVARVAENEGATGELAPATPVLSLVGSYGAEKDWRDRRNSVDHAGIPLISAAFVDAIPMIARLLKELGVPLQWVDHHDSEVIVRTMGESGGLFFVDEASEVTDHQERKIIAAQDFVKKYEVRSVFGTGGAYSSGRMMVLVVFCRDTFSRATAQNFLHVTREFIGATERLDDPDSVFADPQ